MEKIFAIDWKVLVIQAGGFILLLIVFKRFLFGPIMEALGSRQEDIRSTYEAADSEKTKAEELRQDYDRKLANIEAEAREKINAAIKDGQTARDEILDEARSKADAIMRRSEEELARERDKVMQELREEVVGIAIGAATKLIEKSMDDSTQRKLVSNFVEDLEVRK